MRLAYLAITNAFAVPCPLPASDRDKDTEILVLRHQLAVLERQPGGQKVRSAPTGRCRRRGSTRPIPLRSRCDDANRVSQPVSAENFVTSLDLRLRETLSLRSAAG
jgi:hypothetical protein